jgi:hypothetical protein
VKRAAMAIAVFTALVLTSIGEAETLRRREFKKIDDTRAWEVYGQNLALGGLILPTGPDTHKSVRINQSAPTAATIHIDIRGPLPKRRSAGRASKETRVSMRLSFTATFR